MTAFQHMTDSELETLVERLTHYALGKLRRLKAVHGVRYRSGQQGPKGTDPGDFVNIAVEKYLDGDRPWNHKVNPTIEEHLKDVIDSLVSNAITSVDQRRNRAMSTVSKDAMLEASAADHRTIDPRKWVADQEWSNAFRSAAYEAVKDDQAALNILEALQEGYSRQESIEMLRMEPAQFDADRKRMNRRIEQKCGKFYKEITP